MPPLEVMGVFDRMIATDEEIAKKKQFDREVEQLKSEAIYGKSKKNKGNKNKKIRITKNKKFILLSSFAWIIWTIFRTSGHYQLFGLYLHRWDDDMFLVNAILPIFLIFAFYIAYKWICGVEK